MPVAHEGRAQGGHGAAPAFEEAAIEGIWRAYKGQASEVLRNRLVVHYMRTHVRRLAERLHASLPQQVDLDDLVQQGYLGLVDAIERFEIDRNVRFETFSARRIFGSMRDYLRQIDPMPRLARARVKHLESVCDEYFKEHGRPPSDEVLRRRLRLPRTKLRQLLATGRAPAVVSYHSSGGDGDGDEPDPMDALEGRSEDAPLTKLEREDLKRLVTRGFSRRDHLIVVLYYYEQMTMREVGAALGISESRVSQRLESIIKCLRARLSYREAATEFT